MKKPDLCQICLRFDRDLKKVDQRLSDLHDELCDYILDPLNSQYCIECVHLLKKVYNFQVRCKNAIIVFKKWKNTKAAERKPVNLLYTLLPPTSLGLWTPDNSKVYTIIYEDQGPETSIDFDLNGIPSNNEIKTETEFKDVSAGLYSQNLHSFHPQVLKTFEEVTVNDGHSNNDEQLDDNDRLLNDDVKKEKDLNDFSVSDDDENINTKGGNKNSYLVVSDHCYTKGTEEQKVPPKRKSLTETDDDFNCDDDTDVDNDMGENISESDDRVTTVTFDTDESISDDDETEKCKIKEKVLDKGDITIQTNISDGDDDQETEKSKIKKKVLDKGDTKIQRNISDDDDEETEKCKINEKVLDKGDTKIQTNISDNDDEETEKSKIKKKVLDKGDTKIQKNKIIAKRDNKDKTPVPKKVARLELMRITVNEDDQNKKLKRLHFSKERFMLVELEKKFAAVGEIKASDGATIDKQFILTCLNEKVNESTLGLLWNSIRGRQHANLKPRALNIFRTIHNKYRNDHQYESVFEIEYLNTEEKVLGEFQRRKTYECYRNAEHKCGICYQGFKHEKLLENHSKCHQDTAGSIVCIVCNVHCTKSKIYNHMMSWHAAVYKCKRCPLVTHHRTTMVNHYEQHQGKQYICELCGVPYKSRSSYMTHRGLAHRSVGEHICTLCGRSFYSGLALKAHKTRMHTDHVPTECGVECSECALTFASHEVYLRHVRSAHKGVLPDGTRPQRLKTRTRKSNKYKMTCRVCNAVGTGYGWLNFHFRLKHPTVDLSVVYADTRKHLCEVCGKAFTNLYMLRYHMNKHTGSRPFVCGTCFKRFHGYMSLQNHRLTHLPPTKRCPQCGKMFRTSTHLSVHIRSHTRDRCYKCSICGKGFLHSSSLNAHVRGVHHHMRRVKKKGVTEAGAKKVASHAEENSE